MLVLSGAVCLVASIAMGPKKRKDLNREAGDSEFPENGHEEHLAGDRPSPRSTTMVEGFPGEGARGVDCGLPDETLAAKTKMWCCATKGLHCPELDCEAGYKDWRNGWSTGKKIWCCL